MLTVSCADEPQPRLVKKLIEERGGYDFENVQGGTPFPNGYLKIGGTEHGSIDRLSTFACDGLVRRSSTTFFGRLGVVRQ